MNKDGFFFEGRFYAVRPDIRTYLEIEDELGSLAQLKRRLQEGIWTLAELITVVQIFLQSSGKQADFLQLGAEMTIRGIDAYRIMAVQLIGRLGL